MRSSTISVLLVAFSLATLVNTSPARLDEAIAARFRSLRQPRDSEDEVNLVSGYAQVRRQGRKFDGSMFDVTQAQTARSGPQTSNGRSLPVVAPLPKRFNPGPIFNLENFLREEALKLKARVIESSLEAAHSAEEAVENLESVVEVAEAGTKEQVKDAVENFVGETVKEALKDVENMVLENVTEETSTIGVTMEGVTNNEIINETVEDVEDNDDDMKGGMEQSNSTMEEESGLSKEVDLGSVKEV